MKFIHIADTHLGAAPESGTAYSGNRPKELWNGFERIIGLCEEEQTDLLLIAGDMFHRQPLLSELKEVNFLFSRLTHTKVVFIVGNHDYLKPDSYYHTFEWNENVFPILSTDLACVGFAGLDVGVYGFSYDRREITEPRYDSIVAPGDYGIEILLAHGGDEKHIPLNKKCLAGNGFTYAALGHIHKPQIVVENQAVFAGALEPLDKNDTGIHGFIKGEITSAGVRLSFEPSASREYVHLEIDVDQTMTNGSLKNKIREEIEQAGRQNIYKIILKGFRDPDIIFDMEDMDVYGNVIEIVNETKPAFDYKKLLEQNEENLLGKFIEKYINSPEKSIEYQALYEGVQALIES